MDPATRNDSGQIRPRDHLGKYAIVRELGQGGMAQVFEGWHPELECPIALKVLRPTIAAQPRAAARFLREAKAAGQIRHPNIVRVFDISAARDIPFIVMEFLEGEDLAGLLLKRGPLCVTSIVEVFLPVVSAVATAHVAGVIHRDLKPANLMLTRRPPYGVHPFVLDFGISKILSDDEECTLTGSESLLGTVQYMAPELTRGAKFATAQSDQYAIGAMLYECATGRRPFSGDSQYELMHAIVTAPIVAPSTIDPRISPEFDAIVLRAMARDPAHRFPSVHALGRALHPMGSETTRKLWEREFWNNADYDLWSPDASTSCDQPAVSMQRRKQSPGSRLYFFASALFGGVVAAAWVALRLSSAPHPPSGDTPPSSSLGQSLAPTPRAEPRRALAVVETDTSPRGGETSGVAEPPNTKARSSPNPESAAPAGDDAPTKGAAEPSSKKMDRSAGHPPILRPGASSSPQLGTNGALIID